MLYKRRIITLVTITLDTLLELLFVFRSDASHEVFFWIDSGSKRTLSHSKVIACRLKRLMVNAIVCHGVCPIEHISCLLESEWDCPIEFVVGPNVT